MQNKLATTDANLGGSSEDQCTVKMEDGTPHVIGLPDNWPVEFSLASGEIKAICACDHFVLVAQEYSSGSTSLSRVSLPDMQLQSTKKLSQSVCRMWLNCDATRVAIVDLQV